MRSDCFLQGATITGNEMGIHMVGLGERSFQRCTIEGNDVGIEAIEGEWGMDLCSVRANDRDWKLTGLEYFTLGVPPVLAVVEVLSGLVVKFPGLVELSGSGDSSTIRSLV